ncbi:hypothetical protein NPIL_505191 [Nephila pilipes]|uniref:Integrase catalytic domain-containing protein n=1 Tax=Nephila pilipes TaxID=299642 RepID=A0A8X6T1T5_NEPPI|nr:hypothetical protein NPIL_505191 [Nephila pilipes]
MWYRWAGYQSCLVNRRKAATASCLGIQYCPIIFDGFSRWPDVIPTPDMTDETTPRTLMHAWISRFGYPVTTTTSQGTNFQ